MAFEHRITVLRLPPYHCELTAIELIWAQVKSDVARNNKTYQSSITAKLFVKSVCRELEKSCESYA